MKTRVACSLVFALFVVGCGSDTDDPSGAAGDDAVAAGRTGSGGKTSLGGKASTGGRTSTSAGSTATAVAGQTSQGGTENLGGTSSAAGSPSASGASANGGATTTNGGTSTAAAGANAAAGTTAVVSAGGAISAGGSATLGGAPAAGRSSTTGGTVAIAGTTATGGSVVSVGGTTAVAGRSSTAIGGTTGVGGLAATGGVVAVAGAPATGGACATTYYRDADNDSWGSAEARCTGGTGWVTRTGDCNDANVDVHPDQTATFDKPYTATNGSSTFDYNCDGTETTTGGVQISTGACATSGLGNSCTGDGYLPVDPERAGTNVNQICGSMRYLVCARSQQICIGAISTDGTYEAVHCR